MIAINQYTDLAICIEEKENGIFFKRKKQEESFYKLRIGANSFAEAQETLCNEMPARKISIAFIFPYIKEDTE